MTLRRTGFKKKQTVPLKRSGFKKKTPLRGRKINSKRSKSKTKHKGYVVPKWFSAIKLGSHGNTPAQKKYWRVITDTYRKEDFERYGGKCVSCPTVFERWQDGQLGHYKAWSVCNSWFKYERKNLALQCGGCNRRSDGPTNDNFKEELKRRHGNHIIEWIEKTNAGFKGQKMETWEIVDKVAKLRPDLVY